MTFIEKYEKLSKKLFKADISKYTDNFKRFPFVSFLSFSLKRRNEKKEKTPKRKKTWALLHVGFLITAQNLIPK